MLDTHTLLWWYAGDRRLSARARRAVGNASNEVLVSAASAWEIATKERLGKLDGVRVLVSDLADWLAKENFSQLSIKLDHALRAARLPGPLRDPFDRMLIAQASAEELLLVSNEAIFDEYDVRRYW
ncbi:MAG: type II toxin-antitoxin system VapC family toxin [Alphaproteobacteria bacterium]